MNFKKSLDKTTIALTTLGLVSLTSVEMNKSDYNINIGVKNSVADVLKKKNRNKESIKQEDIKLDQEKLKNIVQELRNEHKVKEDKLLENITDDELIGFLNKLGTTILSEDIIAKSGSENDLLDYLYIILLPIIISGLYGYTYSGGILNIIKNHNEANSSFYRNFFFLNGLACIRNGFQFGSLTYAVGTAGALIGWRANERLKEKIASGEIVSGGRANLMNYLVNAKFKELDGIIKELSEKRGLSDEQLSQLISNFKKDLQIKNILEEYVIGEKNPVVIYTKEKNNKGFPEEYPLFWNPTMEKLTGYSFEDVKNLTQIEILDLLYGHDKAEFDRVYKQLKELEEHGIGYKNIVFTLKTKQGELIQVAWHSEKIKEGGRISFGSCEQAEIQKILRMDLQFDCLNGKSLYNDFGNIISQYGQLNDLEAKNKVMSFMYCDIDKFSDFNTHFGHRIGDVVLSEFIDYIQKELRRKDDNLYRLHGDEFIVLCNFANKEKIITKADYIKEHFSRHTIIVEFANGQMIVNRLKHGSYLAAKAYYNANKALNTDIIDRIKHHEENLQNKKIDNLMDGEIKGRLVLSPITTTWGISDYYYDNVDLNNEQKNIVDRILEQADSAMYKGKGSGRNTVTIF